MIAYCRFLPASHKSFALESAAVKPAQVGGRRCAPLRPPVASPEPTTCDRRTNELLAGSIGAARFGLLSSRSGVTGPLVYAPALAQFVPSMYVQEMTQAVAHILDEFERLSEKERRELRRAIVERVPMPDDLTDGDFAPLAAASFRALDEEENPPRA
jgi:hypothetical protein